MPFSDWPYFAERWRYGRRSFGYPCISKAVLSTIFFWLDICVGLNFLFGWDGESVGCVKEYPWIGALVRWT